MVLLAPSTPRDAFSAATKLKQSLLISSNLIEFLLDLIQSHLISSQYPLNLIESYRVPSNRLKLLQHTVNLKGFIGGYCPMKRISASPGNIIFIRGVTLYKTNKILKDS